MKYTILVILYNKENIINDTTKSLIDQSCFHENFELIIFNNGPALLSSKCNEFLLDLKSKFSDVSVVENVNNNPLSLIYNDFLNKFKSDYYIILDDDTKLTDSYFEKLIQLIEMKSPDVLLPAIISEHNKKIYYPFIYGESVKKDELVIGQDLGEKDICSIGSGLTLSNGLINKLREFNIKPFDDNFALYGVDFSFFRNLRTLKNKGIKVSIYIVDVIFHDMSGVKDSISRGRFIERELDKILSIRHYSSNLFYSMIKIVSLASKYFVNGDFYMFLLAFKVYFSGKHPRCMDSNRDIF